MRNRKPSTDNQPSSSASTNLPSSQLCPTTELMLNPVRHARSTTSAINSIILLATARVRIFNRHAQNVLARILLDQGSEVSLVTENLVQQLCIPRKASHVLLRVGNQSTFRFLFRYLAHVLSKLTTMIPAAPTVNSAWPHIQNLPLADPQFGQPGYIDIIIGADVYGQLLDGPILQGPSDSSIAQTTKFGWILSGPTKALSSLQEIHMHQCSVEADLSELLERFWHQEEICPPSSGGSLSMLEHTCDDHFARTHTRDPTGQYIVRLTFKAPFDQLGDSKPAALRMLRHLHTKFQKDQMLFQSYTTFLSEYKNLHHMVEVSANESDPDHSFYLPRRRVLKESSTTTKLRVVFNGSCKVINGQIYSTSYSDFVAFILPMPVILRKCTAK
ncbi:uncharacterized protein LOC143181884 [Calliopsis andreniformis]|uniref:uncharacterized protein LOC143181884 n=1 Tax=Calliopsis andreniformis TaxID=337506 RepID=UPI003FCC714F